MASNPKDSFSNRIQCSYHPDSELLDDHQTGDMICAQCGLVVGERFIDPSSEWRMYNDMKTRVDPRRTGSTDPLLEDEDLSTTMQTTSEKRYMCFPKTNSNTQNLSAGFALLATMAERLNATESTVNRAKNLFKKVHVEEVLKHRLIDAKAAACLYIACRQEMVPRTFKEVCAVSAISKKEIVRCFKIIIRNLTPAVEHFTSEDFISRFCCKLFFPVELQKVATHIAQKAVSMYIVPGRSPVSVAAAAIYLTAQVSGTSVTLRDISETAGVAEMTIRSSFKQMHPHSKQLFPEGFLADKSIRNLADV